jgi:hypothetical protein
LAVLTQGRPAAVAMRPTGLPRAEATKRAVGGIAAEAAFERIDHAARGLQSAAAIARGATEADANARLRAVAILAGQRAATVATARTVLAVAATADRALLRHGARRCVAFVPGDLGAIRG